MHGKSHPHHPLLFVGVALLLAIVFAVDAATPRGVSVWVLYFLPLALTVLQPRPLAPLVVAAVASILVLATFFLSAPGLAPHLSAINRIMGLASLWSTALLVYFVIVGRAELARVAWLQAGRNRVLDVTAGEPDRGVLGLQVLRALAEHAEAQAGTFYRVAGAELLHLASLAGAGASAGPPALALGQTLVGRAAAEGRSFLLREVPPDYSPIASSLGAMAPRSLAIVPIGEASGVTAVMELGFARTDARLEDLARVVDETAPAIARALRAADDRLKLNALLEQTRRQGEELQAQQEELKAGNEELEEQAQALRDSQERLEAQSRELEVTNRELEEQTAALEQQRQDLLLAQETLQRNARALERANQYKSEFLANMSHELRTPLNSALILSRLLAENRGGRLAPEEVRYAETIAHANRELLALINDILDLSKVEAGQVDIQPAPVVLAQIVEPLRDAFAPIAAQKGIAFAIDVDPAVPPALVTDAQRTAQVLRNLLSNAVKFTESGGVTLRVEPAPGQHIAFVVRDTGIGIAPQAQEMIFEAFRQADGSTSRRFGGTGLGLSISRQLAHALGGEITLESALGVGSAFRFLLPLAPPDAAPSGWNQESRARGDETPQSATAHAPARPAPAATASTGRRTILVIEDDAAFSGILADLAREHDFDVLVTPSAEEGLRLAQDRRPAAILLDVGLPDGSGLGVLERLKRDPATRPIPVHVISVTDYAETALALGAVGCALKPVAREEIAATLRGLEARLGAPTRTVLIAEDDAAQRESLVALLGGPDVAVETVRTVREALERLAARTYDCMVLDLALADGSAFDLLDRMAAGERYAFPPVIVYTGRVLSAEEEQRLRRYARSIVVKGARSPERLLDEATLFLHRVESDLPPEQQRMLVAARQRDAVLEGRRVLLAEDDVRNVFALCSVLEPLGMRVVIARNGREALEKLRGERVDLVLMDVMMPEMDGLAAIRAIRRDPALAGVPIVALTAKAMPEDRADCLAAGANDYMAKPVEIDRLVSLLRVWMPR